MHRIYGLKIEDEGFLLVFFSADLYQGNTQPEQETKQNKICYSHTKILGSEKYLLHIFGWLYKYDIWMW